MGDEKFLSKLSINGSEYVIKDKTARESIAALSGIALSGAKSLSGRIANLEAHGADSALSGVNHVQEQLNSLSGTALNGATSLSGSIKALTDQEKQDVAALTGAIATLEAKHDEDKAALSGSIATLSGSLKSTIEGLDAEVTSTDGTFVSVTVKEEDGKITAVNVTENDIASASGLTAETSARTTADTALGNAITGSFNKLSGMVAALDYADASAAAGEFVTKVTQTDGKIAVSRSGISANQVAVTTASGITKTNVQGVLEDLALHITDTEAAGKVTLSAVTGTDAGDYLKVYTIKQGTELVGTIDIPKDLVVTSGEVIVATSAQEGGAAKGEKVLKLTIANQTNPVYIPVKDLTDVYTAGTTAEIATTLSGGQFSSILVSGSIGKAKLDSNVQASLDKADTAIQSVNGIPATHGGTGFNNGDINIYGSDIRRTNSNNQTVEQALTGLEGSVSAIDTRVSGLEAWKEGITITYSNETLSISGLVGSVVE